MHGIAARVTLAGIVAPLSHVNDAGFWLVSQSFRLSVADTFKTWSVMETLLSLVGFGFVSVLWLGT